MKRKYKYSYPITIENVTDNDIEIALFPTKTQTEKSLPKYEGINIESNLVMDRYKDLVFRKNFKPISFNEIVITSENAFSLISKLKISYKEQSLEDKCLFTGIPIVFIIPSDQVGKMSLVKPFSFTLNEISFLAIIVPARTKFIIYLNS